MTRRLTKTQSAALADICARKPDLWVSLSWREPTIAALVRFGYVECVENSITGHEFYRATPAGRTALQGNGGGDGT